MEDEQLLPIDISYFKLADYLVDRRKLPSDWRKRIVQIHNKIGAALPKLPKDAHPWFITLSLESVGYLEAVKIRDILTETTPHERTVFGRLSGIAGEWDTIVRAYEKDSVFLGEAAQIIIQNVNYEIPFQKKQISKLQQQSIDLERKEGELKRNITASASRYLQACQELGITGANIRAELLSSVTALPRVFSEVIDTLCGGPVGEGTELYHSFTSYAHEADGSLDKLKKVRSNPDAFLMDENIQVKEQHAMVNLDKETDGNADLEESAEIQWDITPDAYTEPETLKENVEDNDAGIQWDIDLSSTTVVEADEQEPEASEIVWDIDVEDGDKAHEQSESQSNHGAGFLENEVTVACTGLADLTFRNELLNDLLELKLFLIQRIQEVESTDSSALQNQMQAVSPAALQQHGPDALKEMATQVDRAVGLLTNSKTRDILMILSSRKFLDRLEASLQQKKQNELKSVDALKDLERRRVEVRNAISSSWPKQEAFVTRTRELKVLVEKTLSSQYQGRRVNLIGEINNLV